jgi:hypothetical protein
VTAIALISALAIWASPVCWAAESWVVDPKTGTKIGWVSNIQTIVKASWSGRQVKGKAEGKGNLIIILRFNDGGTESQISGVAEMAAGMLDGKVSLKYSSGTTFEGSYKKGVREGKGIEIFSDGTSYDGEFRDGRWNGKGVLRYPDGSTLEGDFVNDTMTGRGVFRWADGRTYEGDLKIGMAFGRGILRYTNGATYEGGVVDGRPSGAGVLKDPKGAVMYSGEWRDFQDESTVQF